MNLERIKKDIDHQTRNGRDNIYIKASDVQELLDANIIELYGKERVYIPMDYLEELIENYEKQNKARKFREGLKVKKIKNVETKLTKIDENGYYFQEIKEDEGR